MKWPQRRIAKYSGIVTVAFVGQIVVHCKNFYKPQALKSQNTSIGQAARSKWQPRKHFRQKNR